MMLLWQRARTTKSLSARSVSESIGKLNLLFGLQMSFYEPGVLVYTAGYLRKDVGRVLVTKAIANIYGTTYEMAIGAKCACKGFYMFSPGCDAKRIFVEGRFFCSNAGGT